MEGLFFFFFDDADDANSPVTVATVADFAATATATATSPGVLYVMQIFIVLSLSSSLKH